MQQKVEPIKNQQTLDNVLDTLLHNFKYGRRNFTIFQVGKGTLLRVSDVLNLKYNNIFNFNGTLRKDTFINDKKTGKRNHLYISPIKNELRDYHDWLINNNIHSTWLFPSSKNYNKHIDERQFYRVMHKVGNLLNIDYLGTHTMRKTGAYMIYEATNHNIGFVMKQLNHSSPSTTLRYLGIDETMKENIYDRINFNQLGPKKQEK